MKTLTTTLLPERCWIHLKKRYILKGMTLPELPYIDLEYEGILKFYGIPYRKVTKYSPYFNDDKIKEVCEYWHPEIGLTEKELSLPLFASVGGNSYWYCQKNYSEKILSSESIEAAEETEKFVQKQVNDYMQILREVNHYQFAKNQLSGQLVTVCISRDTPFDPIYEINMNHDNFKILRVPGRICLSDWIAIFDMNKIVPNGYLTIQVPKHIAGFVIGKAGANIQAWAKAIGVKKIQVIPMDN